MKKWRQKKIFFLMSRKARVQFSRARRSCRFQRKFSAVSAFSFFPFFFCSTFLFQCSLGTRPVLGTFFLGGREMFSSEKKKYLPRRRHRANTKCGSAIFFLLYFILFFIFAFLVPRRVLDAFVFDGETGRIGISLASVFSSLSCSFLFVFFRRKKTNEKKQFSSPPDTDPHRSFPPLLSFSFFSFSFFLLFFRGSG